MKKQIVIALTMLSLVVALTVTGLRGTALAHTFESISADVPFDFSDGSNVFQAGKYTIQPVGTNGTIGILIRSNNGKAYGVRLSSNTVAPSPKDQTELVFHRYGEQYFLSQVWTAGDTLGLQLPKSSIERGLEREIETNNGQSSTSSGPAIVTIAARLQSGQR